MKKFFRKAALILSPIAAIATIIGVYLRSIDSSTVVNVKTINVENLTSKPKINELKATYFFRDSVVNNLWRGYYIIQNSGSETIIGRGDKGTVLVDTLEIKTTKNFRLLKHELIHSDFPISIRQNNHNSLGLGFVQWRPDEYFEVQVYFEGSINDSLPPSVIIDERDILDAKVQYSTLKSATSEKRSLADLYLPNIPYWILFGLGMLSWGGMLIAIPVTVFSELHQRRKYKVWKKEYGFAFRQWAAQLVKDKKLTVVPTPENLPEELWEHFDGPEPKISDFNEDNATLLSVVVLLLILSAIPMLWMIKI